MHFSLSVPIRGLSPSNNNINSKNRTEAHQQQIRTITKIVKRSIIKKSNRSTYNKYINTISNNNLSSIPPRQLRQNGGQLQLNSNSSNTYSNRAIKPQTRQQHKQQQQHKPLNNKYSNSSAKTMYSLPNYSWTERIK